MVWWETAYGLALCAVAGLSGAVAAVFGKLAGLPNLEQTVQILCYVLLIVCNGLMLVLYSRSLRHNSSLASTAATLAANISCTGLLGRLVFGEGSGLQWWVGASSIVVGSLLIARAQKQDQAPIAVKVPAAAGRAQGVSSDVAPAAGAGPPAPASAGQQGEGGGVGPPSHSYAVLLQYDGTAYWGWQLQPVARGRRGKPTVQLRLEAALCRVTGEARAALKVQAAGRTDAGVHARGQVAQFFARRPHSPAALLRALNALLPPDVRATAVQEVPLDWNVRYAARKTYCYDLHLDPVADPFLHRWRLHPRRPDRLRLGAMAEAAAALVGTHNFAGFTNWSEEAARKAPVKTILRYQLLPLEAGVRLEVEGTGFLYKQVRHMTGALLAVGSGAIGVDDVAAALAAGERVASGAQRNAWRGWMVADAKGLCLQQVVYAPFSSLGPGLEPAAGSRGLVFDDGPQLAAAPA